MSDEQVRPDDTEENESGWAKILAPFGFFGICIFFALFDKGERRSERADERKSSTSEVFDV